MKEFLQINNITKLYGKHKALDQVSMSVPEGSIFGLLGPNGAGKTSLIRIINQITYPDKGNIFINRESLNSKHISMIGYMPEERGLYKDMKIGEQAIFLSRLKGIQRPEAIKRIKYWFDVLEIGGWWNKKIGELSKGMAQKVQFMITVLHEPKLLIFDEPFSGFDPINTNLIKNEILRLNQQGATVIFSTHRMESVEELCSHVSLINRSKNILEGSIDKLKTRFKSNECEAHFISDSEEKYDQLKTKYQPQLLKKDRWNKHLHKWKVNIKNWTINEFVSDINDMGYLHLFKEIVPSMNEIFITQVQKNNDE